MPTKVNGCLHFYLGVEGAPLEYRRHSYNHRRRSCWKRQAGLLLLDAVIDDQRNPLEIEEDDCHLLEQQRSKFLSAIIDALPVCCIHNPDQGVRLLEVVSPV